ncbi:Uncharacterised protein [Vibrio cholerae]|nr:Uncharacterised protein [Vibrio cholerae]
MARHKHHLMIISRHKIAALALPALLNGRQIHFDHDNP